MQHKLDIAVKLSPELKFYVEKLVKEIETMRKSEKALVAEFTEYKNQSENEKDALRAEVERLKGELKIERRGVEVVARLMDDVDRLRVALEELLDGSN